MTDIEARPFFRACSDTRRMPDASEADPYAAACIVARRRGWRILLAIEKGNPPWIESRLSRVSFVDSKGDVRAWADVRRSLEAAARELLRTLARSEADGSKPTR